MPGTPTPVFPYALGGRRQYSWNSAIVEGAIEGTIPSDYESSAYPDERQGGSPADAGAASHCESNFTILPCRRDVICIATR